MGNLVSDLVLAPPSNLCDAFRFVHPVEPGFTRLEARLDYIFVPRALAESGSLECDVLSQGFPSDHTDVSASVEAYGPCTPVASP